MLAATRRQSLARRQAIVVTKRSIEIADDARFQVVDRRDDLQLSLAGEASNERARRSQPRCGAFGALLCGVVDEIAGVVSHRDRRRQNRLDHRADRAGIGGVLGDDVAGRLHCAAAGVGEDDDERRAEHGGAVFDGAEGRSVDEIAGVPRDEEFADAVTAEDQLRGHAAVGAADDRRPGRLMRGDCAPLLREVDRAEFRMARIALVARFQRGERLVGGERGRRAFGGARLPRQAAEPERDDARRPEFQKIPPTDPFFSQLLHMTHHLLFSQMCCDLRQSAGARSG